MPALDRDTVFTYVLYGRWVNTCQLSILAAVGLDTQLSSACLPVKTLVLISILYPAFMNLVGIYVWNLHTWLEFRWSSPTCLKGIQGNKVVNPGEKNVTSKLISPDTFTVQLLHLLSLVIQGFTKNWGYQGRWSSKYPLVLTANRDIWCLISTLIFSQHFS